MRQALEDIRHGRCAALGGEHGEFAIAWQRPKHLLDQIRFDDLLGMRQHARRRRVVASQEGADHFDEEGVAVQTKLIIYVGNRVLQEIDSLRFAAMVGISVEALHNAFLLGQTAEAAIEIRVGAFRFPHCEFAET